MSELEHAHTRDERTPAQQKRAALKQRALDALRVHGSIGHAAAAAGVSPRTIYRWRDSDPDFAAAVTEWLHVDQVDELHASLYTIAKRGTEDPKYSNASVKAADILLKALDPATYGDRLRVESEQTISHQIQILHEVRDDHRAAQIERLQALQARTIDALVLPASTEKKEGTS